MKTHYLLAGILFCGILSTRAQNYTAPMPSTGGNANTIINAQTLPLTNTGDGNTFLGLGAGGSNTDGHNNTFAGAGAGGVNSSGFFNTGFGGRAGAFNANGSGNTLVGYNANWKSNDSSFNTMVGVEAGGSNLGNGNVFLGYHAGSEHYFNSNSLIISNDASLNPLIFGDFKWKNLQFNVDHDIDSRVEVISFAPGNSGLRLSNLTNGDTPVDNLPGGGVLTVNGFGDVILVHDQIGDASATNELQTLSVAGSTLSISNGNTVTLPSMTEVDGSVTNELQALSISGASLSISNGNTVTLPDASASNELQNLSISGNTLTISNGNSVTLPSGSVNDTSIYKGDGSIINTGTDHNRYVKMNDNNIVFLNDPGKKHGRIYIGSQPFFPNISGNYELFVEGGILTEKVKVALRSSDNWADYVFAPDYKLMPLADVANFVQKNKHLPGVPSSEELAKDGLDLADMQAKQMEKIEELTLYVIEQEKAIKKQNQEIDELKAIVKALADKK